MSQKCCLIELFVLKSYSLKNFLLKAAQFSARKF